MIRIRNLAVPFTETASLEDLAAKRLMLPPQQIAGVVIVRKAVDARRYHGAPIQFVYILDVRLEPKLEKKVLQKLRRDRNVEAAPEPEAAAPLPKLHLERRPVVVGFRRDRCLRPGRRLDRRRIGIRQLTHEILRESPDRRIVEHRRRVDRERGRRQTGNGGDRQIARRDRARQRDGTRLRRLGLCAAEQRLDVHIERARDVVQDTFLRYRRNIHGC